MLRDSLLRTGVGTFRRRGFAYAVYITAAGALAGCRGADAGAREPEVRFEIRDVRMSVVADNEVATGFATEGRIVAVSPDEEAARLPYLVLLRVHHEGGGNPADRPPSGVEHATALVTGGEGRLYVFGGTRAKRTEWQQAETWMPPRHRVEVVGYFAFTPVPAR